MEEGNQISIPGDQMTPDDWRKFAELKTVRDNQWRMVTTAWRSESFPKRLLTGWNWALSREGLVVDFTLPKLRYYPIVQNDEDADSCLEWADGYVSVLRTENEPSFRDSPPRLGKARVGTRKETSRTGSKKRRKR